MHINRRQFLTTLGLTTIATQIPPAIAQNQLSPHTTIKPPRLKIGDTIGLISPAGIIETKDIKDAKQTFTNLGLKIKKGAHILDHNGYLAGTDINRAKDIHAMFVDKSVKAIIAMRGSWGCNRILPLLS
jgi:muramoyltetrapeptide carboxypeptidase